MIVEDETIRPSRRLPISIVAGIAVAIALPALAVSFDWLVYRARSEVLLREAFSLLEWLPVLGASLGFSFWLVRFHLAELCLGSLSDVYPGSENVSIERPLSPLKRTLRKIVFWGILGAIFGTLAWSLFETVMSSIPASIKMTRGILERAPSQGLFTTIQETTLNLAYGLLYNAYYRSTSDLAEFLLIGPTLGILVWVFLLICLRKIAPKV